MDAMIFLRLRLIVNTTRKRDWNVIDILGSLAERFIDTLGYPEEVRDVFDEYQKFEGVDVKELDFIGKKDKHVKCF